MAIRRRQQRHQEQQQQQQQLYSEAEEEQTTAAAAAAARTRRSTWCWPRLRQLRLHRRRCAAARRAAAAAGAVATTRPATANLRAAGHQHSVDQQQSRLLGLVRRQSEPVAALGPIARMAHTEVKLQHGGKKGWLFKWTNYLKGYQRRWFVLSDGLLSYYRYTMRLAVNSSFAVSFFLFILLCLHLSCSRVVERQEDYTLPPSYFDLCSICQGDNLLLSTCLHICPYFSLLLGLFRRMTTRSMILQFLLYKLVIPLVPSCLLPLFSLIMWIFFNFGKQLSQSSLLHR